MVCLCYRGWIVFLSENFFFISASCDLSRQKFVFIFFFFFTVRLLIFPPIHYPHHRVYLKPPVSFLHPYRQACYPEINIWFTGDVKEISDTEQRLTKWMFWIFQVYSTKDIQSPNRGLQLRWTLGDELETKIEVTDLQKCLRLCVTKRINQRAVYSGLDGLKLISVSAPRVGNYSSTPEKCNPKAIEGVVRRLLKLERKAVQSQVGFGKGRTGREALRNQYYHCRTSAGNS